MERAISERNRAVNTRCSYRDTLCQPLPFVSGRLHKAVDRLAVVDVSPQLARAFLSNVEVNRGCCIATRNQRFGIHTLVERNAARAQDGAPSLATKRVSPRCIRHSTATHLLSAGVDINTVRAWFGHASLNTTNVYAEINIECKALTLAKCEISAAQPSHKPWHANTQIMQFLRSL